LNLLVCTLLKIIVIVKHVN
ncbi:unnamed protein product, partial [Callosobruchus maculatus]